jgi:leader peptidase (prepilin peptidase)/N-methyltransferase
MVRILGTIFVGLLGLAFGSFLNVCVSRWPEDESVVEPRSHCRNCGRTLSAWENIPLVSWIALRGRCRTCQAPISWRYPLVELALGILWALVGWQFPLWTFDPNLPRTAFIYAVGAAVGLMAFYWLLVALAVLDGENLWLPNRLTVPGALLGYAFAILNPIFQVQLDSITGLPLTSSWESLRSGLLHAAFSRLLGILAAAGLILLIRWVYWLIRRQEGIGLGDAKLMALLAAWLGFPGALLAFVIGVLLGTIAAVSLLLTPKPVPAHKRSSAQESSAQSWSMTRLPLGTFLCIGGIISALWGQQIIAAYLRMEGF